MSDSKEASHEADSRESKSGETKADDETVMHGVARTVGTAIGVIASTATKIIGQPEPTPAREETKSKKPRKSSRQQAASAGTENKHSAGRTAKKKKKRKAHRLKLKRSNTKG